jgi:hypothetical protein
MPLDTDDLAVVCRRLEEVGWTTVHPPHVSCVDLLVTNDYATVGIVVTHHEKDLRHVWLTAEQLLADYTKQASGRWKDLYLIVLLHDFESQRHLACEMRDSTTVCRKVCVWKGDRPAIECLSDIPLLRLLPDRPAPLSDPQIGAVTAGMPEKLLDDLRRRGKDAILDKLLKGDYGRLGDCDEAQGT